MERKQSKIRACVACGKQGHVVMEHRSGDTSAVFCVSCAQLLASDLEMNQHGDYVQAWAAS